MSKQTYFETLTDLKKDEKVSRKVVTEVVEKKGGVQSKTTTITCTKDDFDEAFKKLNVDPEKFQFGGTSVTRKIVYTNSSGQREVLEETVETYDDPQKIKDTRLKSLLEKPNSSSISKSPNHSKDSVIENPVKNFKVGEFENECLQKHNEYRQKHGVAKLLLSDEICAYAKEWADHLAATDSFKHRSERKYGENIFCKWSSNPNHQVTGSEAVESWYSEIKDHTFGQEPKSLKSGHFTQVIWKESNQLGVAWARSKSGKVLVVANYDPAGNFIGKFTENVPPPKK